ncbi:MAG: hypothetical protein ACFB9M_04220 [Myxococcota bacterium]
MISSGLGFLLSWLSARRVALSRDASSTKLSPGRVLAALPILFFVAATALWLSGLHSMPSRGVAEARSEDGTDAVPESDVAKPIQETHP